MSCKLEPTFLHAELSLIDLNFKARQDTPEFFVANHLLIHVIQLNID